MATLGNSTTPSSGFIYNDYGSGYEYWSGPFTMPTGGGTVTDLYVYVGGDGASSTGNLCIWGSTALLWSSSGITFPSNSRTNGGQQWLHVSVPNIVVPAGTVNLGFWAGGNIVMTQEASGTMWRSSSSVGGSPTALPGSPVNAAQALGAYITYTPGTENVGARRSGSWTTAAAIKARRTSAWATPTGTYERRSSAWTRAF